MIIHGVNGDKNLNIEIAPGIQLGSRFDTLTLSANDVDLLARMDPVGLHMWITGIQARFPPRKVALPKTAAQRELEDLLS